MFGVQQKYRGVSSLAFLPTMFSMCPRWHRSLLLPVAQDLVAKPWSPFVVP